MSESQTRREWRTRIWAIIKMQAKKGWRAEETDVDGWLEDFMQTPALRLAEMAQEHAEEGEELAVVRGSIIYELGDKMLAQVMDEETVWERPHHKVILQEEPCP